MSPETTDTATPQDAAEQSETTVDLTEGLSDGQDVVFTSVQKAAAACGVSTKTIERYLAAGHRHHKVLLDNGATREPTGWVLPATALRLVGLDPDTQARQEAEKAAAAADKSADSPADRLLGELSPAARREYVDLTNDRARLVGEGSAKDALIAHLAKENERLRTQNEQLHTQIEGHYRSLTESVAAIAGNLAEQRTAITAVPYIAPEEPPTKQRWWQKKGAK